MDSVLPSFNGSVEGVEESDYLKVFLDPGETARYTFGYWVPADATRFYFNPSITEHAPVTLLIEPSAASR